MQLPIFLKPILCCIVILLPAVSCTQGCTQDGPGIRGDLKIPALDLKPETSSEPDLAEGSMEAMKMEVATFGGGCFWCVEAVFLELEGVNSVSAGYMGGKTLNPTYEQVCSGTTGHAEIIHIEYDPSKISFDVLLQVFWTTHDPTTLNRQGNDVGTQYRSVVFYHDEKQKQTVTDYKEKLNKENTFSKPVVTEIAPASTLYLAEDYHQNYFANNPNQPYCRALIPPKLEKLRKVFGDKLKK